MVYKRFVPPPVADRDSGRQILADLLPLLLLLLAVLLGLSLMSQPSTKVSIDVLVSSVQWKNVEKGGKDPERYGFELAANDSSTMQLPPATIKENTSEPYQALDGAALTLRPFRPFRPVQLRQLVFPDQASVRLTQADSTLLLLSVSAAHPGNQPALLSLLSWQLVLPRRGYLTPAGHLDTVGASDGSFALSLEKSLASGETYTFEFIRPHNWKGPYRLVASALAFTEPDVRETEAISSVLGGTVKLLETTDPPLVLAERDMLSVRFEQPVEIFLRGTSAGIRLHVEGVANRLVCGPRIMGEQNDQMPSFLSTYHHTAAYLAALLGGLVGLLPALLEWLRSKPKHSHL